MKRNQGRSIELIIKGLNLFITGWVNYYAVSEMKSFIEAVTGWIRHKIRVYVWKQWKKVKTRFKNLQELGVDKNKAWEWANARKGLWRISQSPILQRTLTNDYIGKLGFKNPIKMYSNAHIKVL